MSFGLWILRGPAPAAPAIPRAAPGPRVSPLQTGPTVSTPARRLDYGGRGAGSEERSNPLRIATSKWTLGRKEAAPPSGVDPLSGLACPLVRCSCHSLTPGSLERGCARIAVSLV